MTTADALKAATAHKTRNERPGAYEIKSVHIALALAAKAKPAAGGERGA